MKKKKYEIPKIVDFHNLRVKGQYGTEGICADGTAARGSALWNDGCFNGIGPIQVPGCLDGNLDDDCSAGTGAVPFCMPGTSA